MLKVARKRDPKLREESKEMEEKVKIAKKEKFIENQEQKIAMELNDIDRKSQISENVKKHGGPFMSLADLDHFLKAAEKKKMSRKFLTDHIKDEIRFQKIVVGHKNFK